VNLQDARWNNKDYPPSLEEYTARSLHLLPDSYEELKRWVNVYCHRLKTIAKWKELDTKCCRQETEELVPWHYEFLIFGWDSLGK